jgi:glycosyltransferase involved in cell wall biosynthesis
LLEDITPLLLTYNEEANIGRALDRLRWARDIVIVDSFSNDNTVQIASGFPQLRVFQRQFDSHAQQWNFGLRETDISTDWVLALDADYILTDEFNEELAHLSPDADAKGYRAQFIYCINDKRLKSGIYPAVPVLYRRDLAEYVQDGHTQKIDVRGRIVDLKARILHDDRKSFAHWLEAQGRYTKLEAAKLRAANNATLSWSDRIRTWRVVAPAAMLLYCLIFRGGVFDGWAGFYYAFQRTLAELMLSLHLLDDDLRSIKLSKSEKAVNKQSVSQTSVSDNPSQP